MTQKLKIRDLTMRDGQQSLFATRMSQESVDKLLPYYEEAGFYAIEVWGGAVPDSVMRYLGECPWNRLKSISAKMQGKSLLTALSRGRNLFGYVPYPTSVIEGFYKQAIADGLNVMRIFDALNDLDNVRESVEIINRLGGIADGAAIAVWNDLARVECVARVTDKVPAGTAVAEGVYSPSAAPGGLTLNALMGEALTDAGRAATLCANTVDAAPL